MRARWRRRCGSARCSRIFPIERGPMTASDFAKPFLLAAVILVTAAFEAPAQQTEPPAKTGKPINAGDILSGQLNAMRMRGATKGKRVNTFQLVSEPRRLPP